jgi:2-phospho-L-lactate/phosphoenolpyruvate guanylyltransferase
LFERLLHWRFVIVVLVPVKRLADAKSRLAAAYDAATRRALQLELAAGVVAVARATPVVDRVLVATSDPDAAALADSVSDGGLPWNDGLAHAIAQLHPRPDALVILAADLPLVRPDDIEALVRAIPARGVVVARARDGGSNGLGLRPPDALVPGFGAAASAALHLRRARGAGLEAVVCDRPGLALDLDTPADVRDALELLGPGSIRELLVPAAVA